MTTHDFAGEPRPHDDHAPATTTTLPAAAPLVVDGPGRYQAEVFSGGLVRRFLLVVPESAPDPAPLVLVFHGFTRGPEEIEATSGMSALAEEHGFVVAYPAGTGFPRRWLSPRCWATRTWSSPGTWWPWCPGRWASTRSGSTPPGCPTAAAWRPAWPATPPTCLPRWGRWPPPIPSGGSCEPARPVPVAAIHGTADPIVPYEGLGEALPAVEGVLAFWVGRTAATRAGRRGGGRGCDPVAWGGCTAGADVVLYRVAEGRHGWPGSGDTSPWGATTDLVSASALLWEFFAAHPHALNAPGPGRGPGPGVVRWRDQSV